MRRINFVILICLFVNGNSAPIKDNDKSDEDDTSGSIFDLLGLTDLLSSFTGFLDYEGSEEEKIVVCKNCTVIVMTCRDCNKTETSTTKLPDKTPNVTVSPSQFTSTTTTTQPTTSPTAEQE